MAILRSVILSTGLALLANAYTDPTTSTYGALLLPDGSHPLTQGQKFTITWDQPTDQPAGQTVSLVLCRGNSNNCVPDAAAIVEKVDASLEKYDWDVPCSLPVGTASTDTGYGMLIIVDGTGVFQYSTQFSVLSNPNCDTTTTTTTTTSDSTTSTSTSTTSTSSSTTTTTSESDSESGWSDWADGWTISSTTMKTTTVQPVTTTSDAGWSNWTPTAYTTPAGTRAPVSTYQVSTTPSTTVKPYTGGAGKHVVNAAGALIGAALAFAAL